MNKRVEEDADEGVEGPHRHREKDCQVRIRDARALEERGENEGRCLVRVGEDRLPPESRRKLQANIDLKIRSLIAQGIEEKAFDPVDPKLAAFAVAGALNSIARWYRPEGELKPHEIASQFVQILMKSLVARPRQGRKKPG